MYETYCIWCSELFNIVNKKVWRTCSLYRGLSVSLFFMLQFSHQTIQKRFIVSDMEKTVSWINDMRIFFVQNCVVNCKKLLPGTLDLTFCCIFHLSVSILLCKDFEYNIWIWFETLYLLYNLLLFQIIHLFGDGTSFLWKDLVIEKNIRNLY